jgi:hypothetical protein
MINFADPSFVSVLRLAALAQDSPSDRIRAGAQDDTSLLLAHES